MIRWPARAYRAVAKLFEPLQDVDVFVEDKDDETFYTHLLQHILQGRRRVQRVFSAGNRQSVIEAARNHVGARPTVYLVDGDFEWVVGKPAPAVPRVVRIEAYCIENLLIDARAATRILIEEAQLSAADAEQRLAFEDWRALLETHLVDLFALFAAAHTLELGLPTVSLGAGCVCEAPPRGLPTMDPKKVDTLKQALTARASAAGVEQEFQALVQRVLARARGLDVPLDIVSGKDFVLPLLDFHLRRCNCSVNRRTLRFRLALHADPVRFGRIAEAILDA